MRRDQFRRIGFAALMAGALAFPAVHAQSDKAAKDGDWPMYNRDLAGTRYSPLKQITTSNVNRLGRAWSYPIGRDATAGSLSGGSEYTPVVVNGMLYVAASNHVAALEPETGQSIWRYDLKTGAPSRRGVAYWPGDATTAPRIFFTAERRLIALDARSSAAVAAFGQDGKWTWCAMQFGADDLQEPADSRHERLAGRRPRVRRADRRKGVGVQLGGAARRSQQQDVDAEAWKNRSGTYSWAFPKPSTSSGACSMSPSRRRAQRLLGRRPAGRRPLWQLSGRTRGRYRETEMVLQAVHHDLWDYDLPSPPALLDVVVNGRRTPILALAAKTGYIHPRSRHRETGVRHGRAGGSAERRAGREELPTQPVPVKPPRSPALDTRPTRSSPPPTPTPSTPQFCRELTSGAAVSTTKARSLRTCFG
jgi:quinoprotein glucose dehydrogenase